MKIAVIGAGAIGSLVAGYLKLKDEDVSLVGHPDSVKAIKEKGLTISGVRGNFNLAVDICDKLNQKAGLIILATKTQDIEEAVKNNFDFFKDALILTAQNGVQADDILVKYVPKENIISSIVMFGATNLEPGRVVHNFEGNWIMTKRIEVLSKVFPVTVVDNIKGMKYLKIFVNANNCIPAILGLSMQEVFKDLEISKISIGIWKEGLEVVNRAGIKLESLPDFPLERLTKLTSLPLPEAAKIFSGIMANLSKEPLYGSILQSIKRNRLSEIDYINGEFVALAKKAKISAPLNDKLTSMVHEVENKKEFFSKEELINNTRELLKTGS